MTLRNEYKQKTPMLREAEERALPIYVLKSNTVPQMQSSLTSIFSLEIDPREAALRETEEAIGIVLNNSEPVELSPQNAYIRRLQHQMAERANLVSRSRGREPYRRVRLYPDPARSALAVTRTALVAGRRRGAGAGPGGHDCRRDRRAGSATRSSTTGSPGSSSRRSGSSCSWSPRRG